MPSLYNHFESKEAIYAAVLERDLRPVLQALTEDTAPAGESRAQPRKLAETVMRSMSEHPRLPKLIQHEMLTGAEHLTPMLRSWMAPIFARGDELVTLGAGASRWDRDELSLLVLAMYHIIVGYFTTAPLYKELDGRDLLSEEMLRKQARVFGDLVELIFGAPTPAGPTDRPSRPRRER
jgi:AcrR family transcriptional regulator